MTDIDVVVAGAGPTGLTLALGLARCGAGVRIIDKSPEPFAGSRGKGLSARSMEVLEDLGVVEEILAAGFSHLPQRRYLRDKMTFDADPYADRVPTPDMPYEVGVMIAQWRTEQILRERLAEFGVQVEQSVELTAFEDSGETVMVTCADGERIEARYLVGCDGGRSTVRKSLDVGFEGESGSQGMVIGDIEVDGLVGDRWYQWIRPEVGFVALCPFPDSRSWQFQGVPFAGFDDQGRLPEPSLEYFQRIFDQVAGLDVRFSNETWLSTYRVSVRMADRFRVGRVFIAGDAAHVHPPAGGLGMNTGIQDGYNLSWKLASVLAGTADESLLDTYGEERLPVAEWTLEVSNAGLARVVESMAGEDSQGVGAGMAPDGHQLGLAYPGSSLSTDLDGSRTGVRAGERAPDAPVTDAAGTAVRLFDLFRGSHFTVLGFGAAGAPVLRELGERFPELVKCFAIDVDLVDDAGHARSGYGVIEDAFVIVRPDGHVALTAPLAEGDGLAAYLGQFAGEMLPIRAR
jgi:2-polyprenyl-6-methoxyphenol hydroxylase-like FAD-dependent oxidoreductase